MAEHSSSAKRYPRDAEKTRARILESAIQLFSHSAYDMVRSRDIAQKAGVDVALINRYFGSKKNLFLAVLDFFTRPRPIENADDVESRLCDDFSQSLGGEVGQRISAAVRLIALSSTSAEVGPVLQERMAAEIQYLSQKLGDNGKASAAAIIAYSMGMHMLLRLLPDDMRNEFTAEILLEPLQTILRGQRNAQSDEG